MLIISWDLNSSEKRGMYEDSKNVFKIIVAQIDMMVNSFCIQLC